MKTTVKAPREGELVEREGATGSVLYVHGDRIAVRWMSDLPYHRESIEDCNEFEEHPRHPGAWLITPRDEGEERTMSRKRFLWIVSMDTGHRTGSNGPKPGHETEQLLARISLGQPAPVPGRPGYALTGAAYGRCLSFTLQGPYMATVAELGVAGSSRCAAVLWRAMQESAVNKSVERPPQPWAAIRGHEGAEVPSWVPELLESIAWTWLDQRPTSEL